MSNSRRVECGEHGPQEPTFVCRHLVESLRSGKPIGFYCADDDDPRPHAWCSACEEIRREEGEWNDRSEGFAGVTLLCGLCYDRARMLNEHRH